MRVYIWTAVSSRMYTHTYGHMYSSAFLLPFGNLPDLRLLEHVEHIPDSFQLYI
jgi:hypothetical protein